jgi:hypothetical protein
MRLIATIAAVLFASTYVFAIESQDGEAFCNYLIEQAKAQRNYLRAPSLVSGVTQPETGLPMQAFGGISNSLSSDKKAGLTMTVAHRNCELYKETVGAQQQIQYALADFEKKALKHRLELIQEALGKLDELLGQNLKRVQAQNMTRVTMYALQADKMKLVEDKISTQMKFAALYAPSMSDTPVKLLIAQKQDSEVETQRAIARLNRQNNWDVALEIGTHRQINTTTAVPGASLIGAYGQVNITYNLGTRSIDKHLDLAADSYGTWKLNQTGDVVQNAQILKQEIADSIAVEESGFSALLDQSQVIETNLQLVAESDTSAAADFRNQLTADKLLIEVELGDAAFRLEELRAYLSKNF